jgi:hypothetical protein
MTEQNFDSVVTNFFFFNRLRKMAYSATCRAVCCKDNILEKYAGQIHFPISAELKAVSPNVLALFLFMQKNIWMTFRRRPRPNT